MVKSIKFAKATIKTNNPINENKFNKKEKFTSKCEDLDKKIEKKLLESKKQKEIKMNNDEDYKIEKENLNLNLFKDQLAVLK